MSKKTVEFWFADGAQFLHGSEVLETVATALRK